VPATQGGARSSLALGFYPSGTWVWLAVLAQSPNVPQQRPRTTGVKCKQDGPAATADRGG
jgi:hypothetical protein